MMKQMSMLLLGVAAWTAPLGGQTAAPQHAGRPGIAARVVRASLRGITMSDDQKAKVASLRGEYAPKFAALAQTVPPTRARLRGARQQHDTAAARAAMRQVRATRRQGAQLLRQLVLEVRGTLTPDQRPRFNRNLVRVRRMLWARFGPV